MLEGTEEKGTITISIAALCSSDLAKIRRKAPFIRFLSLLVSRSLFMLN